MSTTGPLAGLICFKWDGGMVCVLLVLTLCLSSYWFLVELGISFFLFVLFAARVFSTAAATAAVTIVFCLFCFSCSTTVALFYCWV